MWQDVFLAMGTFFHLYRVSLDYVVGLLSPMALSSSNTGFLATEAELRPVMIVKKCNLLCFCLKIRRFPRNCLIFIQYLSLSWNRSREVFIFLW